MTFISYAQNFEDVMLWRALKHIKNGYYIDVGAWRPDFDSVTLAFYERGWQGINIEPDPDSYSQLQKHRTRDVNLCIAVGKKTGIETLNVVRDTGLSTLDEGIAQKHAKAGWPVQKREVEVTTLASLWEEHVPKDQDVHFLKVDVEGSEEAVLRGNNWSKFRPWIVIVEATLPSTQEDNYDTWEPFLLTASYCFAYADGLNRFYIANEHDELLPAFKYPPNVFDHIKLDIQHQAEVRAQQATTAFRKEHEHTNWLKCELSSVKERVEELAGENAIARELATRFEAELTKKNQILSSTLQTLNEKQIIANRLENELNGAKTKNEELNSEVHHWWTLADSTSREFLAMQASICWRITRPLRIAFDLLLRIRAMGAGALQIVKHGIKRVLSFIMTYMAHFILARPRLKNRAMTFLYKNPHLEAHLYRFVIDRGIIIGGMSMNTVFDMPEKSITENTDLTTTAYRSYNELKAAIEKNKRKGY